MPKDTGALFFALAVVIATVDSRSIEIQRGGLLELPFVLVDKFQEVAEYANLPKKQWPMYQVPGVSEQTDPCLVDYGDECVAYVYIYPDRFEPKDLKVTVKKRLVTVKGKHKVIEGDSHFYDTFKQEMDIPDSCTNKVVSEYDVIANGYGVLTITAPKCEVPTQSTQNKPTKIKKSRFYDPFELMDQFHKFAEYVHLPKRLWPKYWVSGVSEQINPKLTDYGDTCVTYMYLQSSRFGPEDLTVKVFDREVTVQGSHKVIDGNSHFFDTFVQRLAIPGGCEEDEIVAKYVKQLDGSGVLTISAPKHQHNVPTPSTERVVPIAIGTPVTVEITTETKEEVIKETTPLTPLEKPDSVEATTHVELKTTTNTIDENREIMKDKLDVKQVK